MPEFSQVALSRSSPELNFATTTTRSEDRRESQPDSIGASTPQTGPQGLLPTVVTPQITTAECGKKSSASPRMSECEVGGSSASTTGSSTPGSPTSTNTQSRSILSPTPLPQPRPQPSLSPQPSEAVEDLVVFLRSQMMTARLPNLSDKPQCSPVQRQTSNKKGKADAKRKALTSTPVKGDESFPRRAKGAASPRCGAYRYGSDPQAMRNHKSWLIRSLEHKFSRDDEGATIVAKLLYPSPTEYGNGPHGNTLKRKHYLECETKINNEYTPDLCGQIHAYGGGTLKGYNRQRNIMAKRWDADREEWEPRLIDVGDGEDGVPMPPSTPPPSSTTSPTCQHAGHAVTRTLFPSRALSAKKNSMASRIAPMSLNSTKPNKGSTKGNTTGRFTTTTNFSLLSWKTQSYARFTCVWRM